MDTMTHKSAPLSVERVTVAQPAHAGAIAQTYQDNAYGRLTQAPDAADMAHYLKRSIHAEERAEGYRFPRVTFEYVTPEPIN